MCEITTDDLIKNYAHSIICCNLRNSVEICVKLILWDVIIIVFLMPFNLLKHFQTQFPTYFLFSFSFLFSVKENPAHTMQTNFEI